MIIESMAQGEATANVYTNETSSNTHLAISDGVEMKTRVQQVACKFALLLMQIDAQHLTKRNSRVAVGIACGALRQTGWKYVKSCGRGDCVDLIPEET